MIINDWARAAADEIGDEVYETSGPGTGISSDEMVAIITKHCPMLPNVAYMPVPRCDSCKHWDNVGSSNPASGKCRLSEHDPYSIAVFDAMNTKA